MQIFEYFVPFMLFMGGFSLLVLGQKALMSPKEVAFVGMPSINEKIVTGELREQEVPTWYVMGIRIMALAVVSVGVALIIFGIRVVQTYMG